MSPHTAIVYPTAEESLLARLERLTLARPRQGWQLRSLDWMSGAAAGHDPDDLYADVFAEWLDNKRALVHADNWPDLVTFVRASTASTVDSVAHTASVFLVFLGTIAR